MASNEQDSPDDNTVTNPAESARSIVSLNIKKKPIRYGHETFRDARDDRNLMICLLEKGWLKGDLKKHHRIARRMKKCRKARPCNLQDCPICEFRRNHILPKL
jgi:hypothetical protein